MTHRKGLLLLLALVGVALVVLCVDVGRLALAPTREASIDAIRVRNGLVSELGTVAATDWPPTQVPPDFKWETQPAPAFFTDVVAKVLDGEAQGLTAFERAVLLARHLRQPSKTGDPVQGNARETYQRIVAGQGGYCSDFTEAFNALALAAGLRVREWGFTWDTMANGHAFNEVWDPSLNKWVFIDSFVSFYVVDAATGVPLSALEVRDRFLGGEGAKAFKVVQIVPERFEFTSDEKAIDWYRRGLPRMFLLLGNDVFSYEANPVLRAAGSLPRSIEMVLSIALGEHPKFLFVPSDADPEIRAEINAMIAAARWALAEVAAIIVLGPLFLFLLYRVLRRRDKGGAPNAALRSR